MKVQRIDQPLTSIECDYLVVSLDESRSFGPRGKEVDAALGGLLQRLADEESLSGEIESGKVIFAPHDAPFKGVVVVGVGKRSGLTIDAGFRAAATASKSVADKATKHVVFAFDGIDSDDRVAMHAVAGAMCGCVGQDLYRNKQNLLPIETLSWHGCAEEAIRQGEIVGDAINATRRLVNEPPNRIYPETFVQQVSPLARQAGLEVEVWDHDKLVAEKCGALLAVAEGSERDPRLLILRHRGNADSTKTDLALVGKGVTFDSGGYSLKPSEAMRDMKCDMAGAATVVGAMLGIARLKLPQNVVGMVGLVENMISGRAMRVGDVVKSRSGKTIEVLNTDAEGRMVLADVLNVAMDEEPAQLVDLATLTGACLVALGMETAGLMANDDAFCQQIQRVGEEMGERCWPLPMHESFGKQIQSKVADIKNVGEGRWGGAITAAKFLEEFVGEVPWVHIDIAGPAFAESPRAWRDAGATGAFVRSLIELVRQRNGVA